MVLFVLAGLSACAVSTSGDASLEAASAAAYRPDGPPRLTLLTVVNNRTGSGGHSALIVSGSEQVIFDPAGSFQHELVIKREDVLYGMSPSWVAAYKSAHARSTYHVVTQEIEVTPEQAEIALRLVRSNGPVGSAFCANATSSILSRVPGFEDLSVTFFPIKLMDQIYERPGVKNDKYFENDAGDVVDGIKPATN